MVFSVRYRNATLVTNGLKRNIYLLLKYECMGGEFTINYYFQIFLYSCKCRFNSWYCDYNYISPDHHWTSSLLAFWRRRQNRDIDIEFHNKNSKKRPISPKELGMCIQWEILSEICCRNLSHFIPLVPFYTPWKHKKTRNFSDVFRVYKRD